MEVREHWHEQTLDEPEAKMMAENLASPPVGIAALDAEIDRLNSEIERLAERIAESQRRIRVAITGTTPR